ncbi:MAG: cell wall metabolism sensor histidine kinase WalK [Lachnospiraceae bacterium]|nr:cell wall metabolism sensor histidine kinase WalK [Lachnospiraceae bacterium]
MNKTKGTLRAKLKTLRFRIFMALMFIGVLPGAALSTIFLSSIRDRGIAQDVSGISTQAQLLNDEIISKGYLTDLHRDDVRRSLSAIGNVYSGRVMVMDTGLKIVYDTYEMYEGRTMVWENAVKALSGSTESFYDVNNHSLTVTLPIVDTITGEIMGVMLITKSAELMERTLTYYQNTVLITLMAIMAVVFYFAMFLSRRFIMPVRRVKFGIEDMSKGIGPGVLNVPDVTETMEISRVFNHYNQQMKELSDSRQEFVSNVSHELKTPLTSMKVLSDSILSMGDDAPVEMYREFMTDIAGEIERETDIINDLLSLVRMDKKDSGLNITQINMNELIELIMKRLSPIAESQKVDLVLESFRPVIVELDEVKFSLAISNLIENGIKYNEEGGWVHVSINSDHRYCYIRVEDSGMGIPEDSLDHIFERFYRADKSHSREISGNGLGLAITMGAIRMHHGEIKVASTLGEGTTFDVRIPLNYIDDKEVAYDR